MAGMFLQVLHVSQGIEFYYQQRLFVMRGPCKITTLCSKRDVKLAGEDKNRPLA
jgi:hypothetical protein